MKPIAEKKLITIDWLLPATDALIQVDQTKFKQVLLNLLSNAVKFTQPHNCVMMDWVRDAEGGLVVHVKREETLQLSSASRS